MRLSDYKLDLIKCEECECRLVCGMVCNKMNWCAAPSWTYCNQLVGLLLGGLQEEIQQLKQQANADQKPPLPFHPTFTNPLFRFYKTDFFRYDKN